MRAKERDEAAIRHWIAHHWPRIKRLAHRRRASLVFIDETGFLLAPLLRRTWALRGQTPTLPVHVRHRRRVSAIGGLSISPQRRRLGWYLAFHKDLSIRQEQVIAFLGHLRRHLRRPLVVVWDHLQAHQSKSLRRWLGGGRQIHLEYLPGYAPELNANEFGWSYLKGGRHLANYCPNDVDELHATVLRAAAEAKRSSLLRSFVRGTKLPLRL